jgi:hypothetical protein
MLLWTTLKPLVAAAAALALVIASGTLLVANTADQAKPGTAQPGHEQVAGQSADLGDGVHVDFLAIAKAMTDDAYDMAGKPIPKEAFAELAAAVANANISIHPKPTHEAILRVVAPPDATIRISVPKSRTTGTGEQPGKEEGEHIYLVQLVAPPGADSIDFKAEIAAGEWQTVVENDHPDSRFHSASSSSRGGAIVGELEQVEGKARIFVATDITDQPWRLVAIDDAGTEIVAKNGESMAAGKVAGGACTINIDPARLRKLEVQTRPFDKVAICRNVALDPQHPTEPKLEIKK